jgi:hypothetical protein
LREQARSNLYWLNAKVLNHESVVPMTLEAHYAMCRFAERRTGFSEIDESRVQLIQVWRGMGKTTLLTKGRTIQRLLQNPDWAAGIANERQDNANAFLAMIKSEFEANDFLRALFPELIPENFRNTTWTADRIVINRTRPNPVNPSVLATGAGATVTGVHMNEWIVDDILSQDMAENARSGSFSEIEKLNRWIVRLQPLLTDPKRDPLTFIGTPWWPGDSYTFIEEMFGRGEQEKTFMWSLRLPGGELQQIKLIQKGELAIFRFPVLQHGHSVSPKLSLDDLDKLREDDPAFYSAQYLLQPSAGGLTSFRPEHLNVFDWENPKQIRYRDHEGSVKFERTQDMQIIISVDPAISEKSAAARSAIVVMGSNGRHLFLLEAWAARAAPTEVAQRIIEFYKSYRPVRIIIESVAYQMALAEILKLLAKEQNIGQLPIYEYHSGADRKGKMRIAGLEPYFRKGLFYYHPKSQMDFYEEYVNFSPEIGNRTVDILDAIAFQKETWEMLQMLGGEAGAKILSSSEWRLRSKAAADRIRQRFRRPLTTEWNR